MLCLSLRSPCRCRNGQTASHSTSALWINVTMSRIFLGLFHAPYLVKVPLKCVLEILQTIALERVASQMDRPSDGSAFDPKRFQQLRQTVRREPRSEERRVGKECRSRWSPYTSK